MAAKDERLQLRISPAQKRLFERAAEASHQSISAFVVSAAAEEAERVLADRSLIELGPEAAEAFSETLARPAEVNDRLAAALERPRGFHPFDTDDEGLGHY